MDRIQTTLCYVIKNNRILLGFKKKGFGHDKWNGLGGKIESDETEATAAKREVFEECGIKLKNLELAGINDFDFIIKPEDATRVYIFISTDFTGEPQESEEMKPQWFPFNEIPYDQCWDDDRHWLPQLLAGKKFKGEFVFDAKNKVMKHNLEIVANSSL